MINSLNNWLQRYPNTKNKIHILLVQRYRSRPRWWVRNLLMPFLIKKHSKAYIARTVRRDLFPFNSFEIGIRSIIEDYVTLNNGMGSIRIGNYSRIGIGSVVLGEIIIGDHVSTGQHCMFTGLNHNYELLDVPMNLQGCYSDPVIIEDDVLIGANTVILAGVKVGTHSFISAGSVVTRSIPPYSIASGNPAKVTFNLKAGQRVN